MNIDNIYAFIIPFVVTTCFFYIEALIHFNMGKNGKISLTLPPLKENFKILGIITFFSFLSSTTTYYLEMLLQ